MGLWKLHYNCTSGLLKSFESKPRIDLNIVDHEIRDHTIVSLSLLKIRYNSYILFKLTFLVTGIAPNSGISQALSISEYMENGRHFFLRLGWELKLDFTMYD
ncbi:hypothetical protein NPIL_200881 [Nephila pilipes]|uniref:Uncharacterized protein n=1 Tax=Nephila pilipes TaxID=299642 RepID=A0A8X6NH66_NEPPI|nr:hypothetical protein NPIL_200881 [Nephila pilipes]